MKFEGWIKQNGKWIYKLIIIDKKPFKKLKKCIKSLDDLNEYIQHPDKNY